MMMCDWIKTPIAVCIAAGVCLNGAVEVFMMSKSIEKSLDMSFWDTLVMLLNFDTHTPEPPEL